jgi:hypothetical protein
MKLKYKLCGKIIGKGFSILLAHIAAHYTAKLLYNEEVKENIILINLNSKASNETFGEHRYDYTLRCEICADHYILKKEKIMFSKLINHIKSHYILCLNNYFLK